MRSPSVCISIPTRGAIRGETVQWLLRAFVELAPNVEVQVCVDGRPLDHNRNRQVMRFLATRRTHLFLLDSDCVPQPQTVQQLLAHDLPLVGAPGPNIVGEGPKALHSPLRGEVGLMAVDRAPGGGYRQHRPLEGMQRVDAIGTAGMLIRRDVLEAVGPPWFRTEYDANGLLARGEDFAFCERAAEAGFEIWADCSIPQRHIKEVAL